MATMQSTESRSSQAHVPTPKKGDKFRCDKCGMAMEITTNCKCQDGDHVHFECCGQEMSKA